MTNASDNSKNEPAALTETRELWQKINDPDDPCNRGWAVDRIRANLRMLGLKPNILDTNQSEEKINQILDSFSNAKAEGRGIGL